MRVLLTTTSFQDTPGSHHDLLASKNYEIIRERGPLPEARMLELVGEVDGLLCGDDAITCAVLQKALPRLKVVSKYGIGLDKIDLAAAKDLQVPVCYTPGVNHHTVAEHTLMLLLALEKNLVPSVDATRRGEWKRQTGHELRGKTLASSAWDASARRSPPAPARLACPSSVLVATGTTCLPGCTT